MRLILPLVVLVIVLTFCVVVYAAYLAWPKMRPGKRVLGSLLLIPHFLLILCIPFSLSGGSAPMGSPGWNAAFSADVLVVFDPSAAGFSRDDGGAGYLQKRAERLKGQAVSQLPFNRPPRSTPMVSISALKISTRLLTAVLIFFMAGLLYPGPRARRSLGAYRIPLVLMNERPAFSGSQAMNLSDSFYPTTGGHYAAYVGHSDCGRDRVPGAADCSAASNRLSNDRGAGNLAGASPETMAATVATPLERQFARIAGVTEMTSSSWATPLLRYSLI